MRQSKQKSGRNKPTPDSSSSERTFRFTSTLEKSNNKLWGCHFTVPHAIANHFANGKSRRVICTINGEVERQCALIPHGNGSFVITLNKSLRESLNLTFGLTVQVTVRKDDSTYGLPMPEELKELLKQDKEGDRLFHLLTPGKLRTLLYIIGSKGNTEHRLWKANVVLNHLKAHNGKINYKQLTLSLRKYTSIHKLNL